ncbi:DUF7697 family protein [Aurantimonas sp. C2-3-R2]|uniref:DUF7697 family protein n=1 Tax=unclassified Aurantimonas TaxID=2638230 RepID=UPI003FA41674
MALRRGRTLLRGLRTLRSLPRAVRGLPGTAAPAGNPGGLADLGPPRPLGRPLRVLPGAVIGWDLNAALSLGDALGLPSAAMAELLPVIEAVMVHKLNEETAARDGPGVRSGSSRSA